ncbi:unnamed protein product [Acanthoscelides obtectus]|uniref:N-acetyltransferase domain-containing protein n=1 Tax=Acanthoscelides obtectus TaxID=200917 RepID=A0A9P0JM50_ACAOB|nr:unnamed protein product [Acanthoscelides obtectus]CAK1624958.1 hypothetical protein AOBTE_LOCUS2871 [Acanthoscelides obtectus]
MYYIVIREKKDQDTPALSEVVRNAYLSNVSHSWQNALFSEVTFQMIIITSALLFIVLGVPLLYCLIAIPIVIFGTYILIYGTVLMKVAQLLYEKKELKCWVAEAYEPLFFTKNPKGCWYKILTSEEFQNQEKPESCRKKIVGTVSIMKHFQREDWAWLFRLAVDKSYRRKGIALKLVKVVQEWCSDNQFNNIELVMTECQEGARQLFDDAGYV